MSYQSRNYRHRNPKTGGDEQKASTPFFSAPKGKAQRKKKGDTFFQAKLTIGQPGDIHEKEADAVASQVVNRQSEQKPIVQRKDEPLLQRHLATSKEDEKLGTHDARMEKDREEPEKPVYTKQMPGEKKDKDKMGIHKADDPKKKKKKGPGMGGMVRKKEANMASGAVSAEIERQSGKGGPMPAKTLAEMNRSFGMDFSHVRIHHDAAAAQLCCELNAQAFTHGADIYFNEGKYNPDSAEGKRLLAHELTHVAQQSGQS